jgi:VCBS repeat-containing protein
MVSFRHWLPSFTTTASQRSRRKAQRKVKTGRSWIAQGVERLESRAMFACLPPTDLALAPSNIDENMAAGTTIGQFSTTDADSSGPFKYSFQGGPQNLDNENFFLTGDVIKTRASFDFEGISSYQVSIKTTDSDGHSFSKVFTIGVNDVQESPAAADDAVLTAQNTPVSGNVLANDSDPEGDTLTASLASQPVNGIVELAEDGSFTYTPNADFVGDDSFTYTADDGNGGTATATVSITIGLQNEAPVATDDAFSTDEDVPLSGNVLVNDADADGDALTTMLDTAPANGVAEMNADGSFTYTPNADFSGEDSFTYIVDDGQGNTATGTVAISVAAVNDAPIAGNDDFATDEDVPLSGNVLVNDTDAEGDSLVAALAEGPANGVVEMNADGSFTYTPTADFNGTDSFTYTVDDGLGGSAIGTVSITINAANDAPVANNDELVTDEDMPATGNVLANDTDADGDSLIASLQDGPTSGTVELNADGSFTYTPNADFNGSDSFTYVADDENGGTAVGTVAITVNATNDGPIAVNDDVATDEDMPATGNVLANDTDADGDSLIASLQDGPTSGTVELNADGSFTYTPNADFNGSDSFTYVADDGQGGTAVGTVSITINAINDAPVAGEDQFMTEEDTPVSGNVLLNDTDAEGDSLTVELADAPANGSVELNSDGSFTYTPSADFSGVDTFTYTLSDGNGGTALGTATIVVDSVNDDPTSGDDAFTTNEDVAAVIPIADLLANDGDIDGDLPTFVAAGGGVNGTVEVVGDTVVFTPAPDFNGTGSFEYAVQDGNGGFAFASVTVTVDPVADAPVANNDAVSTEQGVPLTVPASSLLANDTDADGDALSVVAVGGATGGTVSLVDGNVTFTPNADFTGSGTFHYVVSDGTGNHALGQVAVEVTAVEVENTLPVAADDSLIAAQDTQSMIAAADLLANDFDADGDVLSIMGVGDATGGTVEMVDDQITFTPDAGLVGVASFTYTISDGRGGTATGTVTLDVVGAPENPPPSTGGGDDDGEGDGDGDGEGCGNDSGGGAVGATPGSGNAGGSHHDPSQGETATRRGLSLRMLLSRHHR